MNFSRIIWENNLRKVQEHNLQADLGVHSYWLGMNRFADLVDSLIIDLKDRFSFLSYLK